MGVAPPAAVGGPVLQNIDPFASLFTSYWGFSVTPVVLDTIDSAIGVLRNPLAHALEAPKKAVGKLGSLSPLPVLLSVLFEQSGDDVVSVMDLCGLEIDWAISSKEGFSDKTRKRAYRQKIAAALSGLPDEEKLRVSWIIAMELVTRVGDASGELSKRLSSIGWALSDSGLVPADGNLKEVFFPEGSEHDAYVELRRVLQATSSAIDIVDPYLGESIFTLLSSCPAQRIQVRLLTSKLPIDFPAEQAKFVRQYPSIQLEVKLGRQFHDRFIVIDRAKCYHIGASIKDAGSRAMMISKIEDKGNVAALLGEFSRAWQVANLPK